MIGSFVGGYMFITLKRFFTKYVAPKSQNEDRARAEFILNIFLCTGILLTFVAFSFNLLHSLTDAKNSISSVSAFLQLAFFIGLYLLSRKGYTRVSSVLLLATFFLLAIFMASSWGVDLAMVLLTYVLVIVMAGILVNTTTAFLMASLISLSLIIINVLHVEQIIPVDRSWRTMELWGATETCLFSLVFFVIATISWLSNREMEKSLKRARTSEEELKRERDLLEVKVEQRTQELKEAQMERVTQLYRFAEFGRISAGLFHDLMNPLSAVALNMEQTASIERRTGSVSSEEAKEYLDKAVRAAKKLEDLVASVRRQLMRQAKKELFSVCEEIELVTDVLSHKARSAQVEVMFESEHNVQMVGDAVKFNQIMLNLIANAIDAYPDRMLEQGPSKRSRTVRVSLSEMEKRIIVSVKDEGQGISEKHLSKIFEPFFTTKAEGHGIGLSTVKRMVEKDFAGAVSVESEEGVGTLFTLQFPLS